MGFLLYKEIKMANYCMEHGMFCENATIYGHCKITACSKYLQTNETNNYIQLNQTISLEKIIFPQTIGNITFYNAQQLIKWVEDQQRINEDPDYGIGNWS